MRTVTLVLAGAAIALAACSDTTGPGLTTSEPVGSPATPLLADGTGAFAPGAGDRILFDTRAALQAAQSLREALVPWATSPETRPSWAFTTNVDGAGTHALRLDWPASASCVNISLDPLRKYFPTPLPTRLYTQWRQLLGRTPTGGGWGEVARFAVLRPECGTRGRLIGLTGRAGSAREVELRWRGPVPAEPALLVKGLVTMSPNQGWQFLPQEHVGEPLVHTLYTQGESAPGASDGVVRYWVNSQLLIEQTGLAMGAEAFRRFTFPGPSPAPVLDQSEYFWDLVVWEPRPGEPPPPPPTPVASVEVLPASATLEVGRNLQLTAATRDETGSELTGRSVAWSSSNTAVATVSSAGLVSGVAAGSATITATSEGKSGSADITVTATPPPPPPAPVATVTVTPSAATLGTGQTAQLQATLRDTSGNVLTGRVVTWSTSSALVATVSSSGLVTGVAAGSATITATSESQSGTSTITVTAPPPPPAPVATVMVSPSSATIGTGQTTQLQATLRDASGTVLTGRAVSWVSSNTLVATVTSSGLVMGVTGGTATVTATSEGKSGTSAITVGAPPPPPPPPPPPGNGMLISASELAALPMSGSAWTSLKAAADGSLGLADLTNQDNKHSVQTLAVALVAARTGDPAYYAKARAAIMSAVGSERVGAGNSILALGRILGAYVLAADLIGLRTLSSSDDAIFRAWLDPIRTRSLGGHSRWYTLKGTCEDSSNNWGAFACASLVAAHLYLGDAAGVARSWQVFQGFTGDRAAFVFPDVSSSWRCTGAPWTPINVASNCGDKFGAPPEDAHRSGNYPAISRLYVQETMQGLAFQAELLQRAGYPAWPRLRLVADFATRWAVWNASAVGTHLPWWYNKRLGISASTQSAGYGRLFGYTDWLYGS